MGNIINIFNKYFYNTTNIIEIDDIKEPSEFLDPSYRHRPNETIDQYIERTCKHDKDFR